MPPLGTILSTTEVPDKQIEHGRVTTGSVASLGEADVSLTWPTAFPDTNYTVAASVELDLAGEALRVRRIRTRTTTGCTVNIINNAATAQTGTLHAIAIHD